MCLLGGNSAGAGVTAGVSYSQVPGSPFSVGAALDAVAANAAGTLLAAADYGSGSVDVELVNASTGALTAAGGSPVSAGVGTDAVAFSPNGQLLATTNLVDGTVDVFSVAPGGALTQVASASTGVQPRAVAFSPDGHLLAVANYGNNSVSVFTVAGSGALSAVPESFNATGSGPVALAFNPGGDLLAVANEQDGTVSIFTVSAGSGALLPSAGSPLTVGDAPAAVTFSPDGSLLAVADSASNDVSVFTASSAAIGFRRAPGSPFATGSDPESLAFNGSGSLLATANSLDGTVTLFNVGNGGSLSLAQGAPFPSGAAPRAVIFVPNSALMAVGSGSSGSISILAPVSPPTITIAVPSAGQTFTRDEHVTTSFACADGGAGAGIHACRDGLGKRSGSPLNTSRLGRYSLTVTAVSTDGLQTTTTVRYRVIPAAPIAAALPTIHGKPAAGHVLTCNAGRWRGHPTRFSFQWQRGGVLLAGATHVTYQVGTLDEGSTFACSVTAHNGNVGQALSASVTVPLAPRRHCPAPTGVLSGRALGGLRLGQSRSGVVLASAPARIASAGHLLQLCVSPRDITVGFEDRALARLLPYYSAHDQVLWILTGNPHYSTDGVGPGVALTAAMQALPHGTLHDLGRRQVYLARTPAATLVLVANGQVVTQIGIAENRLTARPKLVAALLASLPR